MKVRKREKIEPICAYPGDTIELIHQKNFVDSENKIVYSTQNTVLKSGIDRNMVFNEAVIFDVEKVDFIGVKDGIGGAFLVTKKEKKKVE